VSYFKLTSPLSISDFIALYQENSLEFMAEKIYQNRQRTSTRNGILKAEASLKVAQVLLNHGVNDLDGITAIINNPAFEVDFKGITGQGSGVSLRYFYMLVGLDSEIKPDRMIIRFIEAALSRPVKMEECHPLLTATCQLLKADYPNLSPRLLDNLIWQFQRQQ